jgi:predicted alpha/beta-hydrolase family hydrolase
VTRALEIDTPHGPARAHLDLQADAPGVLVLGHGAGGGVSAPDLTAAGRAARSLGWSVVLVEQPYRVAGRRSPAPAVQLDAAWTAVLDALRAKPLRDLRVVVGGRSSGARVACRTAAATEAIGVLCLAFPLHPPGRPDTPSRQPELASVRVPVLVVQGDRDPFGLPKRGRGRKVVVVPGDHSLRSATARTAEAVGDWLGGL